MDIEEESLPLMDYCSFCGFMINNFEKAAAMSGTFVDFNRKVTGDMNVVFCSECWLNVMEIESGGMRTAVAKRRACESNDREDQKEREKERDRDRPDA